MARRVSQDGTRRPGLGQWTILTARDRRNLAVLGAVAAAIRLALILSYSPVLEPDSQSYLRLAHQIAALNLHGSPGTRTPGYPVLLLAAGYSPVATWCVQAVLGVVATLLVYWLARRLGAGSWMAFAAGLLYALDFEVLALEHIVLTETLAGFLLLLAGHLAVTVSDSPRPRRPQLAALGIVLACLCLTRPDALAITVYLAVALWIALSLDRLGPVRGRLLGAARPALWIVLPPLIVLVAWAGVNRSAIGVTSVSTVLGFNMIDHVGTYVRVETGPNHGITAAYVAARPRSRPTYNVSYQAVGAMERASHLDVAHLSGRLLSIALGVIAHHPLGYVASSVKQWPHFWLPPNYADTFATGGAAGLIRVVWKVERVLLVLLNIVFVLALVIDLASRAMRRGPLLSRPALILAGVAAVGLIPATFLAYGDTGRYGYIYFPLVLSVGMACLAGRLSPVSSGPLGQATVRAGTTPIR